MNNNTFNEKKNTITFQPNERSKKNLKNIKTEPDDKNSHDYMKN